MIFRGEKVLDGSLAEILEAYGTDTLRLRAQGAAEVLSGHPSVKKVVDMGQYQEVRLAGDPQALLADLALRAKVELFELARPSLHDVFVRIAGPEAAAAAAASAAGAEVE
jgi:ABC-2 type transport system ATP-binding protein